MGVGSERMFEEKEGRLLYVGKGGNNEMRKHTWGLVAGSGLVGELVFGLVVAVGRGRHGRGQRYVEGKSGKGQRRDGF